VTIYSQFIDSISFFPSLMPNGSDIDFKRNFKLTEEIEPFEIVSYVLKVPKIKGKWVFTLTPTENSAQLYLNPDFAPQKLDQYHFQLIANQTRQLSITAAEAGQFGYEFRKFYVSFKSYDPSKPCTFQFSGKRLEDDERIFLKDSVA
jgi:hypothetical protein